MQIVRRAVGAIVRQGQAYLLIHKVKVMDTPDGPRSIPGIWDFSKGGVKQGETALEAVTREVREETGAQNYRIIKQFDEKICFTFDEHMRQETTMFLIEYLGDRSELAPRDEEIDEVRFFHVEDVCNYLTHQETKDFFVREILQKGEGKTCRGSNASCERESDCTAT